ncbi:MAG: Ig-like domain-containing protein [Betaproteobacteria bacterium]
MSVCNDLFVKLRRLSAVTIATLGAVFLPLSFSIPLSAANNPPAHHDHVELDAALVAPYVSERADEARIFNLKFAYPTDAAAQVAQWRVQLVTPEGILVQEWRGRSALEAGNAEIALDWAGRTGKNSNLPDGIYRVQMTAFSVPVTKQRELSADVTAIGDIAKVTDADVIEQAWDIRVGHPAVPEMPDFTPLPINPAKLLTTPAVTARGERANAIARSAPAIASLPYTVYFGNLHSQTNHSDGGGNVSTCTSSQAAQTGQYSPADAFPYGKAAGLDFLMTSEHNHYFDGSSGTNASASPTTVHNLYQSGLTTASSYNTANPGFLAIYGMEWGVINNGGHMNIFNANELLGWETNSGGALLADTLTPKSDYPTLYALMKQRGWIGQFNHPDTSGQFLVGGTSLGYSADADEVMVLAEVLNTSAFSNNTTETETGRSSFEGAFNLMLERGFHVAPASNQDNHCANWGKSYTNRSGVLLPTGATLNSTNFIDALKARRVFATLDKNSQIILTANGHLMGERFQSSGALTLTANFANTAGRTVSTVNIYEGVPGRNGTVTVLASTAVATTTPAVGKHFYYAKITQDDGKILWSAPVWVEQLAGGGDTTAPTVSASSSGTSGTITFSATASDAVGVTKVEFYVDGVLKGTDTTSPYSFAFNSTTVANGSHSLTAKAYDAANNIGTSSAVSFTVSNTVSDTTAPTVSASSSGTSGTITFSATASDAVGVTKVEFYVDGVLKGTDTTSPYAFAFDSTTVANGSHSLTAKAYDAANNIGTSSAVSFSVSNAAGTTFNETESNGTVATANVVAHSYTSIVATMGNTTDKDYFAVALAANEKITLAMTGPSGNDYDLYLVDSADATLASSTGGTSTESLNYTNGATAKTVYVKVIAYSGSSTTLTYTVTVSYTAGSTSSQLIVNSGFESGAASWTASSGVIDNSTTQASHAGSYKAWMNGYGSAHTDTLYQQVAIPSTATTVTLAFWLKIVSDETTTTQAYDTLKVQLRNSSGTVLTTLATYSNLNKGTTYLQKTFDISTYKGQTVRVYFEGIEGSTVATSFLVDDVTVTAQ